MKNTTNNELTTIPNFSGYSITNDGRVIKNKTFKELTPRGDYQYYTLINDAGERETVRKDYLLNKLFPKSALLAGFKQIENYDRYLISEFGEVWDTFKLRFLKYSFNKNKARITLINNNGEANNISLNQLVRFYFPDSILLVKEPKYPQDVENFKDIPDYPDYMVSKDGRVWNKMSGKFKSVHKLQTGYMAVSLSTSAFRNNVLLHRVLASTFIPNPDNLPIVEHVNDVKTDNSLENLRWSTQKDNMANASKNGLLVGSGIRLTEEQQNEIAQRWQNGELRKDLALAYGVSVMTIDRHKNN